MPYSCRIDAATAGLQAALSCYMEGGMQDVHFIVFVLQQACGKSRCGCRPECLCPMIGQHLNVLEIAF